MEKFDLKKQYKNLYSCSAKKVSLIEVPAMKFLQVEGQGAPDKNPDFQLAIETLYTVAYTAKFGIKLGKKKEPAGACDFAVAPLESRWWSDNGEFSNDQPDAWRWKLMMAVPDFFTSSWLKTVCLEAAKKKENLPFQKLKVVTEKAGEAVQLMHYGPYDTVGSSIHLLNAFLDSEGLKQTGLHHEIYLNDPRRVAPEKIKTIVRFYVR